MEKSKGCEIELGNDERKIFVKVFFDPVEIWIDFEGLPPTGFLCAIIDGIPMIGSNCGEDGQYKRNFCNIEWAINEWCGDQQIVEAIKTRKKKIMNEIEVLKKKYYQTYAP
jgi:hypothetical protein